MLHSIATRLSNRGPREIARLALLNLREGAMALRPGSRRARHLEGAFDRQWGTDTTQGIGVRQLGFSAEQMTQCHRYDPSSEAMLRPPVAMLGVDPASCHFIDYGAGKGRALMIALQLGFGRVTGVELSDQLCDVARRNLEIFASRNPGYPVAVICNEDATTFTPDGDRILAYFYNPFGAAIMTKVREQLESAARAGTQVFVLYANPEHEAVFGAVGWSKLPATSGVSLFRYDDPQR